MVVSEQSVAGDVQQAGDSTSMSAWMDYDDECAWQGTLQHNTVGRKFKRRIRTSVNFRTHSFPGPLGAGTSLAPRRARLRCGIAYPPQHRRSPPRGFFISPI